MLDEAGQSTAVLEAGGLTYEYYPVAGIEGSEKLPYSLTVLLVSIDQRIEELVR